MRPRVLHVEFPPGDPRIGATDGRTIWLHRALSQAGQRCVLEHELEHIARGHFTCQTAREEHRVRRAVARRLISARDLIATWRVSRTLHEWAEHLHVTETVLLDRLSDYLSSGLHLPVDEHESA